MEPDPPLCIDPARLPSCACPMQGRSECNEQHGTESLVEWNRKRNRCVSCALPAGNRRAPARAHLCLLGHVLKMLMVGCQAIELSLPKRPLGHQRISTPDKLGGRGAFLSSA